MSYILDALRKSDQQRRLGGVPTLASPPFALTTAEPPAYLFPGLLGLGLVIAVGIAVVWLRPLPPVPAAIAPGAAMPIETPLRQSAPVALPPTPAKVEPELPRHEPPAAAAPPAALAAPAPRPKSPASARVETPNTPPLAIAATRREATTTGQELAVDAAATAMSQQKSITSSALPVSIRKQLPPLTVAVHAYSDTPQERLVSINGRMLREGDTLAPDLRLEQITPEGMIFSFRGYRFRRSAQ